MFGKLFSQFDRRYLDGLFFYAKEVVRKITTSDIPNINDIVSEAYENYQLHPLFVDYNGAVHTESFKDVPNYNYLSRKNEEINCRVYTFKIPYRGTKELLMYNSDTLYPSLIEGTFTDKMIIFDIPDLSNDIEKVFKDYNAKIGEIKKEIEKNNRIANDFNEKLSSMLLSESKNNIHKLVENLNKMREMGFPSNEADIFCNEEIPIVIRPAIDLKVEEFSGMSSDKQYHISDSVYEDILTGIFHVSTSMERSPKSFSSMGEEDLRYNLLTLLNGMIGLNGSAERFNHAGKTDIFFEYMGKAVFIAECKIWAGPKAICDGLSQLEKYLSWDDTKTCLIVFDKGKHMKNDREHTYKLFTERDNYITTLNSGDRDFRLKMKHPRDESRSYVLTVLFFDLNVDF